jgi:hypothetical protein
MPVEQYIALPYPDRLWRPPGRSTPKTTLSADQRTEILASPIVGISVRIPEKPQGIWWDACCEVARDCAKAGKRFCVESWEGSSANGVSTANAAEGIKDALSVVSRLLQLEADTGVATHAYRANIEWEDWRGVDGYANPEANNFISALCDTFYENHRSAFLEYLGFNNPKYHFKNRDLNQDGQPDAEIPLWLQARFYQTWLMAYQSTEAGLRAKIVDALKTWGNSQIGVYAGVGRISEGKPVGNAQAWLVLLKEFSDRINAYTHYVGAGAESLLFTANQFHPSVLEHAVAISRLGEV